jgi:hypothetical protein
MMKKENFSQLLSKIHALSDPLKRKLFALSVITKALEKLHLKPILIGGSALEFYTLGGYMTGDIDIALPTSKKVDAVFASLGFLKNGRYWNHPIYDILMEAPVAALAGELAPLLRVQVQGLTCYLIGVEDLFLDRLNGFVHWKWEDDRRWAKRLLELHLDTIDWKYLHEKSKEYKTQEAFLVLQKELKGAPKK